jgi:hypothetical protein
MNVEKALTHPGVPSVICCRNLLMIIHARESLIYDMRVLYIVHEFSSKIP